MYGLVFSALVVAIELRLKSAFVHFPAFKNWAFRGLLLIFVGVLSLGLPVGGEPFEGDAADTFVDIKEILAYVVAIIGAIYVVGEILCVRKRMQNKKEKYVDDGTLFASSLV